MANDELSSLSDEDGIDDNGDMQTVGHAIMDFDAEVFRFAQRGGGGKKRRRNRVQPTSPRSLNDALGAREKRYWLRIDGKLMLKTHLELLNTSLANTGTAILQLHTCLVISSHFQRTVLWRCQATTLNLLPQERPLSGCPGNSKIDSSLS